ncbi:glutathione S-transferase [Pseudomonas sp. RIT-PI-a]|uniref:glutathione S-transferase n=1 Tax=Pseudomonas sp. RIT-PI-a TaxID=1681194 RepID=UPI0006768DAD|nr:glutathione S-transferase [Pseudomonas sp. RIT-PI-a]KNC07438.1 glutathione S-transferase [Pseudomonas sp. RIT-PI-a]
MPAMTLYHNPASPFARKVMVLLYETGQLERVALKTVVLSPVSPDASVNQDNPAGKIPALVLEDGTTLHDSRVILEYLDHQHVGNPLIPREGASRWRRLTVASLADAMLDAAVLIRYEKALRPPELHWPLWLDNQAEKIERGLAYLEATAVAELSAAFDIAAIGVACALGYVDFRMPESAWRQRYPGLAGWFAEVSQRESLRSTMPSA